MSVQLSRCVKCGTRLDLRRVEAGKTITCPRCGTVLRKPIRAAAAAPSTPAPVPAPEPEPEPERESEAESGAEEVPAEPAAAPRATRAPSGRPAASSGRPAARSSVAARRTPRTAPPAAKKSLDPKVLLAIGAGVVVLGVGGFIALRSSHSSAPPSPATTATKAPGAPDSAKASAPAATPEAVAAEAAARKEQAAKATRLDYLRRADDADSFDEHLALANWCEREGLSAEGHRELERALVFNPKSKEANEKIGNVLYKTPESLLSSPVYDRDLDRFDGRWLTPEEQATVAKVEGELRSREKALADAIAKDPWQAEANTVVRNVKNDSLLRAYKDTLVPTIRKPYVVFVQDDDPAVARQIGENLASNLCDLQAHVFERFGSMLHDTDKVYAFRFILFASRKQFDDYNKSLYGKGKKPPGPEVLAYYHPGSKTVISYRLNPSDRSGLTGETYSTVFHEGTHQLRAHYTTGGADDYETWTFWWNEGIAEFVAPEYDAEAVKTHKHKFETVRKGRVEEFKAALLAGKYVPLYDMLGRTDQGSVTIYLDDKFKFEPNVRERMIAMFTSLFYAEAWSFIYFLENYDNGKYRDAFEKYCAAEFNGSRYPGENEDEVSGLRPYLQKLLGIENRAGWDELEKKWIEYVKTL
jgi:collagenase